MKISTIPHIFRNVKRATEIIAVLSRYGLADWLSHTSIDFAKDQLKAFVERIERLEEEKKAISDDIRDVYSEAKGVGYDVKTMRKIISLRAMDSADRAEQDALLDTYKHALGMI